MAYSKKLNLIFVHVPKCAGTSIIEAMRAVDPSVAHGHSKWSDHVMRDITTKKPTSFGIVRNPWDRFLSCYTYFKKYGIRQGHDVSTGEIVNKFENFEEFTHSFKSVQHLIKSSHLKNQTEWLDERLNFVGRFEALQTDFNHVCDAIGIAHQTLPHQNKSSHKP